MHFNFSKLPKEYERTTLYGPASETLLAPKGAKAQGTPKEATVSAPGFQLVVTQGGPSLLDFKQKLGALAVEYEAPDVLVYGDGTRHNFRVFLSLTPEWDDTDIRRFACSAAPNGGIPGAEMQGGQVPSPSVTTAEVELFVSACRSIELPSLE
jgi:hypothetical protein